MKLENTQSKGFGKSWTLFKRCLSYFRPYLGRLLLGVSSMVIVGLATAAIAYLVKPALDEIFINKDREALFWIPVFTVLLVTVKGIFQYLQNYLMKSAGLEVLKDLRSDLYGKITHLPVKFFEENQVGMLMSRIISDVTMIRLSMPSLVMCARQLITMFALIGYIFYLDWYLSLFSILVLPVSIYPFYYFARKLRKYSRRNQSKLADISVVLQEVFSGIRVVKAFATEDKEKKKFNLENIRLVKIAVKQVIHGELSSRVMEMVGVIGVALVVYYGGSQVIEGNSTPGTFFSFIAALGMLYEPMKKLSSANSDFQQALAGAERVFQVLDSKEIVVETQGREVFEPPFQELEFKDVTFAYDETSQPALVKLSLKVASGERLAVVGPSGSGKTTLVNMIPRFYLPVSGNITLNGRNIEDYTLNSLRRSIGMVSQDAFLFNMSIADNIRYGQESMDMEAVQEAARAAYAHDFVMELPEGYDTIIGERGVKLSGGQKQRLTIARALLKNPPLLILDEATSALDTESERIVQLALENLMKDRTSIVIAHRLSTVLNADRIVVMERGKIVDQGPHAQLLESCPLYAKLYAMQFQEEQILSNGNGGDQEQP